MKKKNRRKIAVLLIMVLTVSSFRMITFADPLLEEPSLQEQTLSKTPDSLGTAGGAETRDIGYGTARAGKVTVASTIYHAPHPNVSASTGYTLSVDANFYCMGREYDYLYIYWYIGNKEMFGYIPIANTNLSGIAYIQYDIFRPATCSATTPVLSGAGTTNTYMSVGEIYAGESPLMVLGKKVNKYNNRTYYYVQYLTSGFQAKRGWIDADNGTVDYIYRHSADSADQENCYFSFVNRYTQKALTWVDDGDDILEQATFTGALNQTFILEKVYYNTLFSGYYRILSAENPTMALSVDDTGYGEGLPIVMAPKGVPDKRQEFMFTTVRTENSEEVYYFILSRSSGEYRALEVMNGSSTNGTHVIQSAFDQYSHQCWIPKLVNAPWGGVYIQDENGGGFPGNYYAIVDSSASNFFYTVSKVQECLDKWSSAYNLKYADRFDLHAATASSGNILTTIIVSDVIDDVVVFGACNEILTAGASPNLDGWHTNDNWYSTEITLYSQDLDSKPDIQKTKTLTHELGHALKLSHTYSILKYVDNEYSWSEASHFLTVMDQGLYTTGEPTTLDVLRLYNKWGNID